MAITVSQTAADAILKIAENEDLTGQNIRVRVIGGGCAGMAYDIYFEATEPTDMDESYEDKGVRLVIDQLSLQYMDGAEIDYIDRGILGAGFKFNNPQVTSNCGCGKSFSA